MEATPMGSDITVDDGKAPLRPCVFDYLTTGPLLSTAASTSSLQSLLQAPPPLSAPGELSPRRRFTDSGPSSPSILNNLANQEAANIMAGGSMVATPMPTPPTGAPLVAPTLSNNPTPTIIAPTSNVNSNRPLFFHSLSESEPARHSQRSGRLLGELESLHQKHESEFKVLVPAIGNALKATMDAHEKILQSLPLPSDPASPTSADDPAAGQQALPYSPMRMSKPTAWGELLQDGSISHYDTVAPPSLSIQAYVKRVSDFTYISPATLLSSIILVDRLLDKYPRLYLTPQNAYKIFFVAARIASKVLDLRSLNNKNFASVGGVPNQHLNDLESKMLMDLRFDLFISQELFVKYAKRVIQAHCSTQTLSYQFPLGTAPPAPSSKFAATSPRTTSNRSHVTFAVPPPLAAKRAASEDASAVDAHHRLPHPPAGAVARVA